MSNVKQTEQSVSSSMNRSTTKNTSLNSLGGAIVNNFSSAIPLSIDLSSTGSTFTSNLSTVGITQGVNSISQSLSTSSPSTVQSFWQQTENMIIGSQEWNAAYQNLSVEKQHYLQSYSRLYDYISNPVNVSGMNYNFASDSSLLAEMSTYLEKVSIEVDETIHEIYEEINSIQMNGDWEGETFQAFQNNCLKYKEPLFDLVLLIKSFSTIFSSLEEETEELVKNIDFTVNGSYTITNASSAVSSTLDEQFPNAHRSSSGAIHGGGGSRRSSGSGGGHFF